MAEKAPRKFKVLKWMISIVLFISLALVGASWYISVKFKPLIRREIKELVQKSTHGLYRIEFSQIHTNFITGSATIGDVNIMPDTNVFKLLVAAKKAPNNLYYIRLKKLSIKRFHPYDIYFNKKVDISLLLFDNPDITMVNKHFDFNDNRPPRPRKSPYDYIKNLFKSLRVELVDFKNVRFKYVNNNELLPDVDSVANLNVTLKDWLIDSLSAQDTTRLYLLKDVNINLSNYSYATPDSMYHINVNQLDFNASSGKVNIKQFGLIPRYSEADFAKVAGYARDRFTIQLNNISLDGIDLPAYIQKRELIASQMSIADGGVAVFNNNTFPKLEKIKTGRFPHQLLQQLKAQLTIKKIKLSNIDVSYTEFDKRSQQRGRISFEKTSGTIMNVTNGVKVKTINPIMQADLVSYVMGQGKLAINFKFDLNSPTGEFAYKGAITNLDGRKLNQITKPLGMVQVNKGMIKSLAFDIKANQDVATGKVDFAFNDLSVALLKKEEGKARLVRKGLLSILANALVIYSDNPSKEGKFTTAPINYNRRPTGSFFNFIWKTLYQGVKYSVGVTPQREAEIKAQVAKFEKMKDDRDERRRRRQIRIEKKEREQR
ncbi:hypothetical protein GM921_13980 [Pedobacter sp. LMG 31464]|uniref:DUF748 domain-containing protein n=1 Tax=Pedobacter planticolens TaxID=2679964 RepID=A0A923IXQ8_9SPHI|nr:hypothetical protein [Pedobacter planticolens]MBB2146607.1 hypothetical protein [Pedobacter planticolens]